MPASVHALAIEWLTSLAAVFFIVDPFAATPAFLAMTTSCGNARRKQMARRASITCYILLTVFAVAGKYIFRIFGITIPAFKLAGSVLLALVALDMLQARRSRTKETPEEQTEACGTEDVGIIPMGIPMLAGPGALSTVMVLVSQGRSWLDALPVLVSIGLTSALAYIVLAGAGRVAAVLGDTGIRVLTRLMGLILLAIAFQFLVSALADMRLIAPVPLP